MSVESDGVVDYVNGVVWTNTSVLALVMSSARQECGRTTDHADHGDGMCWCAKVVYDLPVQP